jgi:rare lipoprotein A (peptidoglycan hydrolase)
LRIAANESEQEVVTVAHFLAARLRGRGHPHYFAKVAGFVLCSLALNAKSFSDVDVSSRGGTALHQHDETEFKQKISKAPAPGDDYVTVGLASWYGHEFAGRKTATGERFNPNHLTAASRQLPLKSQAIVTNLDNGRSVRIKINDCGPYVKGRKLDLTKRAARKLAMIHKGVAPVMIKLVKRPSAPVYCGTSIQARRG